MTDPAAASERLRTLAALVSDDRADLPAHGLPLSLLSDLKSQISCDAIAFEGFDKTSTAGCRSPAAPPQSPAPSQNGTPASLRYCQPADYRSGTPNSAIASAPALGAPRRSRRTG